jgi:hypothetical protein
MHQTDRTRISVDGHRGNLSTLGGTFGADPEVVVHATWYGRGTGPGTDAEGDLYIPVADTGQLAALIDVLSHATPAQHRELAAAIRKAAADITSQTGEGE